MGRVPRIAPGGLVYHVLNRGNGRAQVFDTPSDYEAFIAVLHQTLDAVPMRLVSYCIMPNHWHLVLWPREDHELSEFMHRLTIKHVRRWHEFHDTKGTGHLYQGPFKSFAVEADDHLLRVMRYVERNALRAKLVRHAEEWRWGSLWLRENGTPEQAVILSDGPVQLPTHWVRLVNQPQHQSEIEAIQHSIKRGSPLGDANWTAKTARRVGIPWPMRARGRPRLEN